MKRLRKWIRELIKEEIRGAINEVKASNPGISVPIKFEVVDSTASAPKESPPPPKWNYYWGESRHHFYFLKEFIRPTPLEHFDYQRDSSERGMGESLESAIEEFQRQGLIEHVKMEATDWLCFLYNKKELMAFCATAGVETPSGTKDDLALLLFEYDPELVRSKTRVSPHYMLTESGLRLAAVQSQNKVLLERVRKLDEDRLEG